jgi:drug/metabolite transporter (DMT)-like permease
MATETPPPVRGRPADMTSAIAIGGAGAAVAGLVATARGRDPPGVAHTHHASDPSHLPAPEVNLIALLETVLGPLWVWLALGETPSPEVLAGGILVVGAVTIHSVLALRAGVDRDAPAGVVV